MVREKCDFIGRNCIVGAESVTSSRFEDSSIIARNSAKVFRIDVTWTRDLTDYMDFDNIEMTV